MAGFLTVSQGFELVSLDSATVNFVNLESRMSVREENDKKSREMLTVCVRVY